MEGSHKVAKEFSGSLPLSSGHLPPERTLGIRGSQRIQHQDWQQNGHDNGFGISERVQKISFHHNNGITRGMKNSIHPGLRQHLRQS